MITRLMGTVLIAAFLLGCASTPDKLGAQYVSPLVYKDYDCDQIITEMDRVSRRSGELYTSLKKTADTDSAQMAAGMILFWPALFFLEGGDSAEATEYARLKGEMDAMHKVSLEKRCEIKVQEVEDQGIQQAEEKEGDAAVRLENLKQLLNDGHISEEEYQKKREDILNSL